MPWIDACETPCLDLGRIIACNAAPTTFTSEHLPEPIETCEALSHAGPDLFGSDAAALAAQRFGSFASDPAEDDPYDGAVLRVLRLDSDGIYALTYTDGERDTDNWSLDTTHARGEQSGWLFLTSSHGARADTRMGVRVLAQDVLEVSAIPNRTRLYPADPDP